jgi:hypothetical protein
MRHPKIFVDFHNADPEGRIRLNCAGTIADLHDQNIKLSSGLKLVVQNEGVQTEGVVEYSEEEKLWVAVIDWDKLPP